MDVGDIVKTSSGFYGVILSKYPRVAGAWYVETLAEDSFHKWAYWGVHLHVIEEAP